MSASQFIQMLENKGLLDPESIVELQKMVEQSKVRVTPEALARILVENGQLTRFQATKLVTELKEQQQAQSSAQASSSRQPTPNKKSATDSVDDLLPPEEVEEVLVEVQEVFEDPVAEVVEVVETTETRSSNSKRKNAKPTGTLLDDGLTGVAVAKAPVTKKGSSLSCPFYWFLTFICCRRHPACWRPWPFWRLSFLSGSRPASSWLPCWVVVLYSWCFPSCAVRVFRQSDPDAAADQLLFRARRPWFISCKAPW
jgi:polyhydroxyalkanoate synthesis regulator phasin